MAAPENIVVIGAAGMLGCSLVGCLERQGTRHTPVTRRELDLARLDSIEPVLQGLGPSAVINASGFNDVNGAELPERRAEVFRINRDAPLALAGACHRIGVPLVHVSTDYVFDGRSGRPYREDDPTGPLQVYGESKLEGERAILGELPGALVARTSTLFGPGRRARPHFVDAVLSHGRDQGVVEVVEPPVSSPTYTLDLAGALLDLIRDGAGGVVHVVNDGQCSRRELARACLEESGLADRVELRVRAGTAGEAKRPAYSALDTARLHDLTGRRLRPWRDALRDYLERARR